VKTTSPARSPVRALLLDPDGTVADSHELIYRCFCATLQKHLGCEAIAPCGSNLWD
jgi:beta-phosphoglucomutase-like phosphatase (HAD superfamily)